MSSGPLEREHARVLNVADELRGSTLVTAASIGDATLYVANAANRNVLLVVKDGSGAVLDAVSPAAVQVAAKAYTYVYAQYAAAINDTVNLVNTQRLPTVFLQPSYTIVVTIGSVQAGDQVSAIRVYMEQFDTGPQGYPTGMVDEDAYVNRVERLGG